MEERMWKAFADENPRNYSTMIARRPEMLAQLKADTAAIQHLNPTISEMVHYTISGETPMCPIGKRRKLNTYEFGYRFCGSKANCQCNADNQSEKIKQAMALEPPEKKQARLVKMKQTNIARYGADHYTKSLEYRQLTQTPEWQERHWEVMEKAAKTNMERHGYAYPFESQAIREKGLATAHRNDSFRKRKWTNPFSKSEVQEQIRETNIARYGVPHPMMNDALKERRKANMRDRYGRDNSAQTGYSDEAWAVLSDREAFTAMYSRMSYVSMAHDLGVNDGTIGKWAHRYGLPRRGRSSFEREIAHVLDELGLTYRTNDRSFGKELDFHVGDFAIEFNGAWWHSVQYRGEEFHKGKHDMCAAVGLPLLTISEPDWLERREDVIAEIARLAEWKSIHTCHVEMIGDAIIAAGDGHMTWRISGDEVVEMSGDYGCVGSILDFIQKRGIALKMNIDCRTGLDVILTHYGAVVVEEISPAIGLVGKYETWDAGHVVVLLK